MSKLSSARRLSPWIASYVALGIFAIALAAQKRFDDLLAALRHALRLAPNDPSVSVLAAQVLRSMGRDSQAPEQCRIVPDEALNDGDAQALMTQIHRGVSNR